jgi:hypothetical protein
MASNLILLFNTHGGGGFRQANLKKGARPRLAPNNNNRNKRLCSLPPSTWKKRRTQNYLFHSASIPIHRTAKMRSATFVFASLLATSELAGAHICVWSPPQREGAFQISTPGEHVCYLKEGPCGGVASGEPTAAMQGGAEFVVRFQQVSEAGSTASVSGGCSFFSFFLT